MNKRARQRKNARTMVNIFIIGNFEFTAKNLDKRRKLKQAVEAKQIINIIQNQNSKGFKNHPAVFMWRPYLHSLIIYYNIFIKVLREEGFNLKKLSEIEAPATSAENPWFLDFKPFIYSHRARLFQKDPVFYKDKFDFPLEYLKIGYIWIRNSKEYYETYNIEEIADKLSLEYINCRYCKATIKTGKRKGEICMNFLKCTGDFCGIHRRLRAEL